jgi:4-hydroxybenzoate polyprenyltransferase
MKGLEGGQCAALPPIEHGTLIAFYQRAQRTARRGRPTFPESVANDTSFDEPVTQIASAAEARAGAESRVRGGARSWLREIRPHQWLKNLFVLAPIIFSGRALQWDSQWRAALAFAAFSLAASGVYVLNDLLDAENDRAHPVKRHRPIAAGEISSTAAWVGGVLLVSVALAMAFTINLQVVAILVAYLLLNVLYSVRLKHIVILDVFALSAFFLLRLLAGAWAVQVVPSVWLLLCGGLLTLYLGFAKRRHELYLLGGDSHEHRKVLAQYTMPFLDQLSVVLLAVTIVAYIMYTRESETAKLVGSDALSYSTAFVLYGVLRYLYLVHRDGSGGGNPAETLLTDRSLLIVVVLWALYCGAVIYAT